MDFENGLSVVISVMCGIYLFSLIQIILRGIRIFTREWIIILLFNIVSWLLVLLIQYMIFNFLYGHIMEFNNFKTPHSEGFFNILSASKITASSLVIKIDPLKIFFLLYRNYTTLLNVVRVIGIILMCEMYHLLRTKILFKRFIIN